MRYALSVQSLLFGAGCGTVAGVDRGPKCIAGLRAFVRIITYPEHANNCCPKCDVSRLGEGTTYCLLAHDIVIDMHVSAEFSAVDLLDSLFMDNSSNFELFLARICCLLEFLLFWLLYKLMNL